MLSVSEDGEERGERARRVEVEEEGGREGRRKAKVEGAAAAKRRRRRLPLRRQRRGDVGIIWSWTVRVCVECECDEAKEKKQ